MRRGTAAALAAFTLLLSAPLRAQVENDLLAGLGARSIGPAGMSGRVAAVAAVAGDPGTIYVGAATGGLWRSGDAGLTWEPLFDQQDVASIGAIAIDPHSPEVLWVGTGEGNPRNSSSVGRGVYKSLDGGRTWEHLGLEGTEKVHRILIDPSDTDTAYVAALGTTWGSSEERGVYKTGDGGASWERVLYVDERTGCADLVMDPTNPRKLIAAMWQHRRWPYFFMSGGPSSGLYVTRDGGASWKRLGEEDGMPAGDLGRIGLAMAPSEPQVVYALIEAEQNSLRRSDDGGASFHVMNSENDVASRPFYFADLRVDPADPDRVYNLSSTVTVSNDGGKTFESLVGWLIHPDHHAMWIDPRDPRHIIDGNDGGVAVSHNRGRTWSFVRNLPLAQYYHVAVDDEVPYNVYGGMQDNGSWRGPSSVWENGGIRNHHWQEVGFGDGFATLPMADDSSRGYAMSQGGELMRWNLVTGERKGIRPDGPGGVKLRFNWNAGIALCPFHPQTVFYGSQFLHRSTDRGDSWTAISPDLSSDNPDWQKQDESGGLTPDVTAAENHCSILTIAPSPLDHDVIWVGTDDGRLHVTLDHGETWKSVEQNVLGVPANTWIPHVEASKHDAAEAFVVFDDHRRASWKTYVFRTRDFGRTWAGLATEASDGYAHVIEQDPVDPELLFLGTEFGLWFTTDGGRSWTRFKNGLPTVAVRALVVHPREHDLVIATHGRAAYVIDDVSPLRELSEEVRAKPLHLFPIADTWQHPIKQGGESRFPGSGEFRGENRAYGALITFWMGTETEVETGAGTEEDAGESKPPKLEIEIRDAGGEHLRTLRPEPKTGLNRVAWDLRRKGFRRSGPPVADADLPPGPEVPPGVYRVVVRYGEHEDEGEVTVLPDPRAPYSPSARAASWEAQERLGAMQETVADMTLAIDRLREDVATVLARAARDEPLGEGAQHPHQALIDAGKELKESLDALDRRIRRAPDAKGIPGGETLGSRLGEAGWGLRGSFDAPTAPQLRAIDEVGVELDSVLVDFNALLGEGLSGFRQALGASGIQLLAEFQPLDRP